MVMARSSVHRRDDTLDLVQVLPKVDKIILVFTTIIQEICLLVLRPCLNVGIESVHRICLMTDSVDRSYFGSKRPH